jgi:PLP dependent protein
MGAKSLNLRPGSRLVDKTWLARHMLVPNPTGQLHLAISTMSQTPATRLAAIKTRLAEVCALDGRDPGAVHLIAVSKTFGADDIRPLLRAGHRIFGENRVQESEQKWPGLREEFHGVDLHLIGPLQSNKTREAVALFDCIHTLDRPKIAAAIAAELQRQNKPMRLFIQVNTGAEPQKAGITPRDTASFLAHCRDELRLPVQGLMCIPPIEEEAAVHFAFLAKLARELDLPALSMGMSGDYETALTFGATHIRVGSAIFGSRA